MELNKIIKVLLASNDFVSLPGLGSFVVKSEPAKLSPDGKSFLPPKQTILFDTSRSFNDGLIERYLQKTYDLNAEEAKIFLDNFVKEVKNTLEKGEGVFFENVGTLKGKNFSFEEESSLKRISGAFGLEEISVEKNQPDGEKLSVATATPLSAAKQTSPARAINHQSSVVLHIVLAASAMSVLMLLAGLMIFVPELRFWKDTHILVESDTKPDYLIDSFKEIKEPVVTPTSLVDTIVDELNDEPIKVEEKVAVITDKKRALFYEEPVIPDDKTYYIIAGSFEKIENAQVLFNTLSKQGYKPEILQSDGRYRIALVKFSDRNRALRELARLRAQKSTEQVWLLGL